MRGISLAERIHRARRISTTFGRIYLGAKAQQWIARRLSPTDMEKRWHRFHKESAEAIYDTAIELRGMILKGCQFLGSRADVVPPEYVEVLARLQDRVPHRSFRTVRRIVEGELGKPIDEVFSEFSEEPIAAASLAQVHEARLLGGERVAVKVQYPEIASLVRTDLANLRALFKAVGFLEKDFDLMPLVEELSNTVPLELDFENEGRNSERVASFFGERADLSTPGIHWDLTTGRVLVMEFIEGVKISDTDALRAAEVDPEEVMRVLIEAYCEQILVHGFFHADPHPGNLLVQPGQGEAGAPRIVFLDFGLAKDLPGDFRQRVVAFAAALLGGDAAGMARSLLELGFETRDGRDESLEEIARVLLEAAIRMRQQAFLDPDITRQAGDEIPRLARENRLVRIPSHLVLVGRVVGLLSGLGRTLDARVDMVRTVMPYVLRPQPKKGSASSADAPR